MASKPLLDRLQQRNARRSGRARFLQLWPEVSLALRMGYSVRDIHDVLVRDQRWQGCYEAFRQHVARANAPTSPRRNLPQQQPLPRHKPTPSVTSKGTAYRHPTNPMLDRRERPAYDYDADPTISEKVKALIGPATDDPMSEPYEQDPYDYSGMDLKVKKELL